jgi:hypothetical protein
MASNPDQFLQALIGTTGLAPIQQLQGNAQNLRLGEQQLQANQFNLNAKQNEQAAAQQYQADVRAYFQNPTPQALGQLISKHPEKADELRKANDARDEPERKSRRGIYGSLYFSSKNKRPELVISGMRRLIAAERAKGLDTTEAQGLLANLEDGDEDGSAMRDILAYSQAQLALDDPAFAKSIGATGEEYTLSQGQKRFNSDGTVVAEVAPEREYLVIPEGGKAVQIGGDPATGEGGDQAAPSGAVPQGAGMIARMLPVVLGLEGGGTLANPKTSPKGARGPMQVMPGTNRDPGFGVKPAQDDSEAERARVGRDYLGAMVGRYNDPAKALAAYNAGPGRVDAAISKHGSNWLAHMPAETRAYVNRGMSELRGGRGGAQQAPRTGDPAGTIYGNPKRGWRTMTPAEVSANGLDAGVTYQQGPEGQIQPVAGQKQQATRMTAGEVEAEGLPPGVYFRGADGVPRRAGDKPAALKSVPTPIVTAVVGNRSAIRNIDGALSELDKYPDGVGLIIGNTPNWISQRADPKGVDVRGAIANIGSLLIHDRSGAAVTISEYPRLLPFIPLASDSATDARKKLVRLRAELAAINQDYELQYSEDQGYRPIALSGDASPRSRPAAQTGGKGSAPNNPVRVRSIQQASKLPPGTWVLTPGGKLGRVK